jgi:hypothetical protein
MDELSWRARLAKSNINITYIDHDNGILYFDFAYRSAPGKPQKWAKTFAWIEEPVDWEQLTDTLRDKVLNLRKELEQ